MEKKTLALIWAARVVVALTFAYAGLGKVFRPHELATTIAGYQLLPAVLVNPLSRALPWLELVCAAGLWIPPLRRGSLLWLLTLSVGYAAANGSVLLRHLDAACDCFGVRHVISPSLPAIDVALALLCWLVWRTEHSRA